MTKTVNNIHDIFFILDAIKTSSVSENPVNVLNTVISLLKSVNEKESDDSQQNIEFLLEQLSLINTCPEKYRYSPNVL